MSYGFGVKVPVRDPKPIHGLRFNQLLNGT